MLLNLISAINALQTTFNILYEKQVANTVGETYKIYLQQHTKEINRLFKKYAHDIQFNLQDILAFNQYVKNDKYEELSRYAGGENVESRVEALKNLNENFVLALSAGKDVEIKDEWQIITPCKILYVVNLDSGTNYDVDLLSILHKTVLDVFAGLLRLDVPNLLDRNNLAAVRSFVNDLQKTDYYERALECLKKDSKIHKSKLENTQNDDTPLKILEDLDSDSLEATNKFMKDLTNFMGTMKSQQDLAGRKASSGQEQSDFDKNDSDKSHDMGTNSGQHQNLVKPVYEKSNFNRSHEDSNGRAVAFKKSTPQPFDISKDGSHAGNGILKDILVELQRIRTTFGDQYAPKSHDPKNVTVDHGESFVKRKDTAQKRWFENFKTQRPIEIKRSSNKTNELNPFEYASKPITISDLKVGGPNVSTKP